MNVQHHFNLTKLNTFGLPAQAAHFVTLNHANELPEICGLPEFQREQVLWLGGGSNILFRGDYTGLVVKINNKGIKEHKRADGKVWIEAQAGEVWHDFVLHTIKLGLSGLENLSLIPGTVGASPVQNIGAYGVEVKDLIDSVQCFDLDTQQFIQLSNQDCQFSYRESLFKQAGKGRYVITSVVFVLKEQFDGNIAYGDLKHTLNILGKTDNITAQDVSDAVCHIRKQKLPNPEITGNVGSFFKNPIITAEQFAQLHTQFPNMPHYPQTNGSIKLAAGWLIEQCGLKGFSIGGASVHQQQALVIINQNHATAQDVQQLAQHIQATVKQRFQVQLEVEPNWI